MVTKETHCVLTCGVDRFGIKMDTELLERILADGSRFDKPNEVVQTHGVFSNVPALKVINTNEATDEEQAGYVLAMRLLQSDLELEDLEMGAIAQFTQPEVMRRVLRAMK